MSTTKYRVMTKGIRDSDYSAELEKNKNGKEEVLSYGNVLNFDSVNAAFEYGKSILKNRKSDDTRWTESFYIIDKDNKSVSPVYLVGKNFFTMMQFKEKFNLDDADRYNNDRHEKNLYYMYINNPDGSLKDVTGIIKYDYGKPFGWEWVREGQIVVDRNFNQLFPSIKTTSLKNATSGLAFAQTSVLKSNRNLGQSGKRMASH